MRAASENEFDVIAYCFMPDHLHLLVEGKSDRSDGKPFIARAKQYSGYYMLRVTPRSCGSGTGSNTYCATTR